MHVKLIKNFTYLYISFRRRTGGSEYLSVRMQFRYASVEDAFILGIISCACLLEVRRACRFAYILTDYRHNPGYGARIKRRYWEKYCAIRTLPSIACVSLSSMGGISGIKLRVSSPTSLKNKSFLENRRHSFIWIINSKSTARAFGISELRLVLASRAAPELKERESARAPPRGNLKIRSAESTAFNPDLR